MASDYERREREKLQIERDRLRLEQQANKDAERRHQEDLHVQRAVAHSTVRANAERAHAARIEAEANAEAARMQAEAKVRLAERQGEAAIAASVGRLSRDQIQNVDAYRKLEEDRTNLQALFDAVGDCVALIEQDGKATPAFDVTHYETEKDSTNREAHPSVYRYANLNAARAKLLDLREEVARIRNWDADRSRAETLARVETYVARARDSAGVQAKRGVAGIEDKIRSIRRICLIVFVVSMVAAATGAAMAGDDQGGRAAALSFGFIISIVLVIYIVDPTQASAAVRRPPNWEDLREAAGLT